MGELYCLNFKDLNENNEPKITSYYPGFDNERQSYDILYDSFGSFLLDMVKEEFI